MPYLDTEYDNSESVLYDGCPSDINSLVRYYDTNVIHALRAKVPKYQSFGVELEYAIPLRDYHRDDEDGYFSSSAIASAENDFSRIISNTHELLGKKCLLKSDGSIQPIGVEIVSIPMTVKELKGHFRDFFDKKKFRNFFDFEVNSSTGMHVHVSNASITPLQMYRLLALVYSDKLRSFFIKQARRHCEQYANFEYLTLREIKRMVYNGNTQSRSRYTALNTINRSTVEFRFFRSPVTYAEFCNSLELCEALIDFTRESSITVATEATAFIDFYKEKYEAVQTKRACV